MNTLKEQIINFDWSLKSIVKASVAIVVIVIAVAIVLGVFKSVAGGLFGYESRGDYNYNERSVAQNFVGEVMEEFGFDGANTKVSSMGRGGAVSSDMAMMEPGMPPMPYDEGGPDAEDYERRNYNASYQTRKFEETCAAVGALKPLEYVVFDNSNKSEDWCNYTFRADVEHEEEVIAKLKELNPRDFDINTSTIERSIEYSDSELAMQERRLESTQQTLDQAEVAFNGLITKATREGDTKTLSEVINNKISTIDRLTQQLLNTQERIDRLTKGRGEQIEQIEYAHFNVSVSKVTFFDGQQFKDEWKRNIQEMVSEMNATLLALTVGLIAFALGAIQFIVFAAVSVVGIVVFSKIMWTVIKRIWFWEPKRKVVQNQQKDNSQI